MYNQTENLAKVDTELFNRITRLTDQIGAKEEHFNKLQTDYRKLASTWLLASLGASGYVLKSSLEIQIDHWYIVFSICMAASAGISILWMMDLKVYQKLLDCFFKEGFFLEIQNYQWLPPFRINIIRSQKSGEIPSKVQYYYFSSITILLLLGIVTIWNFKVFEDNIWGKIICSAIIFSIILALHISLVSKYLKSTKKFDSTEVGILLKDWEKKTGNEDVS